ncbi:MAG: LysR family transcriptional regulator [Actinomycetota bacterium]
MPGPIPQTLTPAKRRRLAAAAGAIDRAERAWAEFVRELGISACARELGITPQALSSRLAVIERRT